MDTRYFTLTEIERYSKRSKLKNDIDSFQTIGIISIADIIQHIENCKTNLLSPNSIREQFKKLLDLEDTGKIYISELESDKLVDILFNRFIWVEHTNKADDPLRLVRILTLYPDVRYSFWTDTVYQEALNY